jgi:hypothetical protein
MKPDPDLSVILLTEPRVTVLVLIAAYARTPVAASSNS